MSFTRNFVVGSQPSGTAAASGLSFVATSAGFNLAAGRAVVVIVAWESANGVCTVADTAGNVYTPLTKQRDATNEFSQQIFYNLSSAANAANIWTATLPAASAFAYINAFPYIPGGTASFISQSGAAPVSADTHAVAAAHLAGDMAVCGGKEFVGQAAVPDAGWTENYDQASVGGHAFDRIDSPGGNITPGFTFASSASWGIVSAAFKDTPSGSPTLMGQVSC